jgi:geranylgeranylglyceryl phosphate synthase family protein
MPTPLLERLDRDRQAGRPRFAVLVDPDETAPDQAPRLAERALDSGVDALFVGGSLVTGEDLGGVLEGLRRGLGPGPDRPPLVLFPGSPEQIHPAADALLLLSLISGRNPELLIGQHVQAAHRLRRSGLELLPTGYLLVDGGAPTTVSYVSNTRPLPRDKPGIAAATALAGEQLGLRLCYLDAGSGARQPVPPALIAAVRAAIDRPLIVGGGIREPEQAAAAVAAGADWVVVGNALERDPERMRDLALAVRAAAASPRTR